MQQGPALPVLSLEGKEEESSGDGKESGVLESAPLGPLSLPASSRGSPKFPRRAPILRTALWVGALLIAFTLIHVAAVKKSGLARRRLAEGGGGLGDSDDDEEVQAIIEDCLSLAEDLSGHLVTDFPPGWGGTTGALTTLSFPQEAFSDGEPGPSLSSWAPATLHLPTPGYPHAGHAQLPPDPPATGSWYSWETPAPAEEAALLSALESDSWLDQIPLIQPQLQPGSWLEYIPSVLHEVQPPHSQGAPGTAGEAAGGSSPAGAFYPPNGLTPFSPFVSWGPSPFPDTSLATALPQPQADDTGPPPFPDTSLATALPQPQADGTPQASAPPTGPRASAGPSQGYPSTTAEQAEEGGTPSTTEQPQGLLQVLQGAKPRGAPAHPFVRLPLVHPAAISRSFNPKASLHPSHTGFTIHPLLLGVHELYAQPSLSPRQVDELLALLESLVRFDPWRLDDGFYREAAGETSQEQDDASGFYENIDEEEEDEDEEEEEEE
ncbi:hypothetical protein ACSSS7_005138 [Eimeria intestinalis]